MGFNEFIGLISALSPILAAVIAFFTAKHTARKEIQMLELQWEREDTISENCDFLEMVTAVSRYSQSGWTKHQRDAMEKISILQSQQQDPLLDNLWHSVSSGDTADTLAKLQDIIKAKSTPRSAPQRRLNKKRKQ